MDSNKFHVNIALKLQAVTCPGVWLCCHGFLEITIKILGYFFRTGAMEPYFPLLCHDVYRMEGYFNNTHSIAELIAHFRAEPLEITLWQSGRRLSVFQGALIDLLHATEFQSQCGHAPLTQLLMKSTPAFPGILSPKVELSVEFFTNGQTLDITNLCKEPNSSAYLLKNSSKGAEAFLYKRHCIANLEDRPEASQNRPHRQQTVCHARDFSHVRNKPTAPQYNATSRRVSLLSNCSSIFTQSSEVDDLPKDCFAIGADMHQLASNCCQLCQVYKEVFLGK